MDKPLYGKNNTPIYGKLGLPVYADAIDNGLYISYTYQEAPHPGRYYYGGPRDIGLGWYLGTGNRDDALTSWSIPAPYERLKSENVIIPVNGLPAYFNSAWPHRKINLANVVLNEYGKGNDGTNDYYDIFIRCGTVYSVGILSDDDFTTPPPDSFKITITYLGKVTTKNYAPSVVYVPHGTQDTAYPAGNLALKMRWTPALGSLQFIDL